MEANGKGFLVMLLPISFLIIFLVTTWKVLLALAVLFTGINIFQWYQWERWCNQVNPTFHQMIRESQGKIKPIDLAMKGNFSGPTAKRYLDTKATEFGASILSSPEEGEVYYFITSSILGSILDSSEPEQKLSARPVAKTASTLLASPLPQPEPEEPDSESLPPTTHAQAKIPLEQQLVFGSLIQSELAKRLNVYSSTVYKRRNDPDFSEWSRSRDPDGIAWTFSQKNKEFFPLDEESSS